MVEARAGARAERHLSPRSIPFFLVHLAAVVGVVWQGWSWKGLALAVVLYYVRMFGVTAGYHRYFSHRTFRTGRVMQFLFAVLASSSAQKGVLWWASHHRVHHRYSDQPEDVHSAKLKGFWWSHVGWILSTRYEATDRARVKDLLAFPELRFIDRWHLLPPIALGVGLLLWGGSWALLWGMFVSTVLLWHGTFTINSLCHIFGRRRYATTDNSKNSLLLALVTMGEGWHNNHHYYQRAVNQGFFWWEIDLTYYLLRALSWAGLVWDLHTPPPRVRDAYKQEDAPALGDALVTPEAARSQATA
jgi:stearoyl-CoA desaturase (delta-9 desaturase)